MITTKQLLDFMDLTSDHLYRHAYDKDIVGTFSPEQIRMLESVAAMLDNKVIELEEVAGIDRKPHACQRQFKLIDDANYPYESRFTGEIITKEQFEALPRR